MGGMTRRTLLNGTIGAAGTRARPATQKAARRCQEFFAKFEIKA